MGGEKCFIRNEFVHSVILCIWGGNIKNVMLISSTFLLLENELNYLVIRYKRRIRSFDFPLFVFVILRSLNYPPIFAMSIPSIEQIVNIKNNIYGN